MAYEHLVLGNYQAFTERSALSKLSSPHRKAAGHLLNWPTFNDLLACFFFQPFYASPRFC